MNREGCVETEAFEGACQCGAVRYAVEPGPARQTVCHCRMCQRATGNAFAPLIEVDDARIAWKGYAKTFRSSNIAERGFCADCGTPLFLRDLDGQTTELMAGTVLTDTGLAPHHNYGTESCLPWIFTLADLPMRPTEETVIQRQWELAD